MLSNKNVDKSTSKNKSSKNPRGSERKMNEQNLIPNSKRTPSELREITKSGGKKSGEVRRKRKTIKQQLELLLSIPVLFYTNKKIIRTKSLQI